MSEIALRMVDVSEVVPSKTNPRKHFDAQAHKELTESVREHGVLQPVLVRPLDGKPMMELVAGERRWRAARAAGRTEIPAVVRELTDKEVLEIQLIENLQRADLHPMEEAEGYERLTKEFGYSVEEMAAKVARDRSYVYKRLKLLALVPKARRAFEKGDLTPAVAILVARVPASLQEEVLAECCVDYDGNPATARDVQTEIERNYMLRLSSAPWKWDDAELLPSAGACSTCPKRTGNQPDLFSDVSHKDACIDPGCFKQKREAWNKRTLTEAKEEGKTVKPTAEVFTQGGQVKSGFVRLEDHCDPLGWNSNKTWKQALKSAKLDPIVTTTKAGDVTLVLPEKEAVAALKETGAKVTREGSLASDNSWRAEEKKRAKAKALHVRIAMAAAPKIIQDIDDSPEFWGLLARAVYDCTDITAHEFVAKRRSLATKVTEARAAIQKWFKAEHDSAGYMGMVVELLLASRWCGSLYDPGFSSQYRKVCAAAGVNLDAIKRELQALDQAKESKPKAKTAPPAPAADAKVKPRGKMSVESRARIAAATKARWAKAKARGAKRFDDPAATGVQAGEE